MKYRKTALVEAEQFLPSIGQIPSGVISDGNGDPRRNPECYSWIVASLEGNHHAKDGDYICTGIKGEKWVVDKEIFEATYELVNAAVNLQEKLEARQEEAVAELEWYEEGEWYISWVGNWKPERGLHKLYTAPPVREGKWVCTCGTTTNECIGTNDTCGYRPQVPVEARQEEGI